jgi:hypothetical protein
VDAWIRTAGRLGGRLDTLAVRLDTLAVRLDTYAQTRTHRQNDLRMCHKKIITTVEFKLLQSKAVQVIECCKPTRSVDLHNYARSTRSAPSSHSNWPESLAITYVDLEN